MAHLYAVGTDVLAGAGACLFRLTCVTSCCWRGEPCVRGSNPRYGQDIQFARTFPQLLHLGIFRRVPDRSDHLHRRELEHIKPPPIVGAFQNLNRPTSDEIADTVLGEEFGSLLAILRPAVLLRGRLLARIPLQFASLRSINSQGHLP
jgi:hypothetical protein